MILTADVAMLTAPPVPQGGFASVLSISFSGFSTSSLTVSESVVRLQGLSALSLFFLSNPRSLSSISISSDLLSCCLFLLSLFLVGVSGLSDLFFFLPGVVPPCVGVVLSAFCEDLIGVLGSGVSVPPRLGRALFVVCSFALLRVRMRCGLVSGESGSAKVNRNQTKVILLTGIATTSRRSS